MHRSLDRNLSGFLQDYLFADVFAIYPIRMDRGKQPDKLVRVFAALKAAGASVRLLIINFHSNSERFTQYRDEILAEGKELGLNRQELAFTNHITSLPGISDRILQSYRFEVPHKVVLDLFHLTNIYVHPSTSESYSLVCQEAAACGNMLFLNEDCPAMRDIYGADARYIRFSSSARSSTLSRPDEMMYYSGVAKDIIGHLSGEAPIRQRTRLRQTRNSQIVFKQWLEPLLYLDVPRVKNIDLGNEGGVT